MAKGLPQYERSLIQVPDAPQFQTPNLQESIRSSQAMSGALDKLSSYAFKQAEKYVISEAEKYTVANPITQEQLEEAQRTGVNPIDSSLRGGMVWNDAVRKLYAQQASAELTNSAYKHYEGVLTKVQNRELTDTAQIQTELETPLKAWHGVLAQIDPDTALQFYTRRINDGNSYFKAASKELKTQEQLEIDILAEETFNGKVKQFRIDVDNQDPTVAFQMYKANIQELKDSFKDSARQQTYINAFEKEFKIALYSKMSKDMQAQYKSEDAILKAMRKGELGVYKPVWDELLPSEQKDFKAFLKNDIAEAETGNKQLLTRVISSSNDYIKRLINDENADLLEPQYGALASARNNFSGEYQIAYDQQLQEVEIVRDIRRRFGKLSLTDFEIERSKVLDGDIPFEFKNNPQAYMDYVNAYYDKMSTKKNRDLVDYTVTKYNGSLGDIDMMATGDKPQLDNSFGQQLALIRSSADYVPGQTLVISKGQIARLQSMLESDVVGSAQRVQLATNLVNTFGNDAPAVFNAIAPKDPVFAQLGAISADDPKAYKATMDTIINGNLRIKEQNINIKNKTHGSEIAGKVVSALDIAPGNIQNVLSAADAYYVGAGYNTENIDVNGYKESIRAVMGGYKDAKDNNYGGFTEMNESLVLIHDNLNADEVPFYLQRADKTDLLQAMTNDVKSLLSEKGVEHSLDDLNDATLKRVGDDYMLLDANDNPFLNESGQIIRVNLHTLRDIYYNKQRYGKIDKPVHEGTHYSSKSHPSLYSGNDSKKDQIKKKKYGRE